MDSQAQDEERLGHHDTKKASTAAAAAAACAVLLLLLCLLDLPVSRGLSIFEPVLFVLLLYTNELEKCACVLRSRP